VPTLSFGGLIIAGTKGFGVNLLLLLGLHWIPPIAFLVPVITGYVTGWRAAASKLEGLMIGVIMGAWMMALFILLGALLAVVSLMNPGGKLDGELMVLLLAIGLVLHLTIFGGIGAMLGGHMARRALAAGQPND
jgi:hypothetical protein